MYISTIHHPRSSDIEVPVMMTSTLPPSYEEIASGKDLDFTLNDGLPDYSSVTSARSSMILSTFYNENTLPSRRSSADELNGNRRGSADKLSNGQIDEADDVSIASTASVKGNENTAYCTDPSAWKCDLPAWSCDFMSWSCNLTTQSCYLTSRSCDLLPDQVIYPPDHMTLPPDHVSSPADHVTLLASHATLLPKLCNATSQPRYPLRDHVILSCDPYGLVMWPYSPLRWAIEPAPMSYPTSWSWGHSRLIQIEPLLDCPTHTMETIFLPNIDQLFDQSLSAILLMKCIDDKVDWDLGIARAKQDLANI